jgi:serine/threonine protein kinase
MHQLCECLDSLHKLNPPIIHRDIKPENIIYHNNKVTLLDFGIARFLDSKKSKDTLILGSVGYAAPEQFGFQQSNPQTDIYALGKLMNYLLNGFPWLHIDHNYKCKYNPCKANHLRF